MLKDIFQTGFQGGGDPKSHFERRRVLGSLNCDYCLPSHPDLVRQLLLRHFTGGCTQLANTIANVAFTHAKLPVGSKSAAG